MPNWFFTGKTRKITELIPEISASGGMVDTLVLSENSRWLFARKPSGGNWLPAVKFRGGGM
jgi:hypothetical protein